MMLLRETYVLHMQKEVRPFFFPACGFLFYFLDHLSQLPRKKKFVRIIGELLYNVLVLYKVHPSSPPPKPGKGILLDWFISHVGRFPGFRSKKKEIMK